MPRTNDAYPRVSGVHAANTPSLAPCRCRVPLSTSCQWLLRLYVLIVGSVLVLLGLVGLASSAGFMAAIQTNPATDLLHLAVGVLFLSIGLWQRDSAFIRQVVGGLGTLFLLVMGSLIVVPLLWGEVPLADVLEITGVTIGGLSILAARYLPDGTLPRA